MFRLICLALQSVNQAVAMAIKRANALPKLGDNYELLASYPAFSMLLDAERVRTLELCVEAFDSVVAVKFHALYFSG